VDESVAERLLEKLRAFIATNLDAEERAVLAQLLAPGIALAYDEDEVEGFVATRWSSQALPRFLVDALRTSGVRVVGLDRS
jgi:hypothetical protein